MEFYPSHLSIEITLWNIGSGITIYLARANLITLFDLNLLTQSTRPRYVTTFSPTELTLIRTYFKKAECTYKSIIPLHNGTFSSPTTNILILTDSLNPMGFTNPSENFLFNDTYPTHWIECHYLNYACSSDLQCVFPSHLYFPWQGDNNARRSMTLQGARILIGNTNKISYELPRSFPSRFFSIIWSKGPRNYCHQYHCTSHFTAKLRNIKDDYHHIHEYTIYLDQHGVWYTIYKFLDSNLDLVHRFHNTLTFTSLYFLLWTHFKMRIFKNFDSGIKSNIKEPYLGHPLQSIFKVPYRFIKSVFNEILDLICEFHFEPFQPSMAIFYLYKINNCLYIINFILDCTYYILVTLSGIVGTLSENYSLPKTIYN